jgi:predicted nucleic acid-binding protein
VPRLAWDSSCFIACFDGSTTDEPTYIEALNFTWKRVVLGQVRLVASRAIEIEVRLRDRPVEQSRALHQKLRACPTFDSFGESQGVRALAQQLQDRLQQSGRVGKYADLIHVSTAISARAAEFWTLDKKLVRWHTEGIITEIPLCYPHLEQGILDL